MGRETDILRRIWKYSLMLLGVVIVLVVLESYGVPGIVPQHLPGLSPSCFEKQNGDRGSLIGAAQGKKVPALLIAPDRARVTPGQA